MKKQHDFILWKSSDGKRYWWAYYDGNYECLASSETFPRLENAQKSLMNFKQEMKDYLS